MKFTQFSQFLLMLLTALMLTACGSGSSSSSTPDGTTNNTVSVSGTVADGYLENAKVCLDTNANKTCDAGEISTISDSSGNYSFDANPADVSSAAIVVEISSDTIDRDTNEAVGKKYVLTAPPTTNTEQRFVSPMTTLVHQRIEKNPALSLEEAQAELVEVLSQASSAVDYSQIDFFADYINLSANTTGGDAVQESYQNIQGISQVVARQMADAYEQLETQFDSSTRTSKDLLLPMMVDEIEEVLGKIANEVFVTIIELKSSSSSSFNVTEFGSSFASFADNIALSSETIAFSQNELTSTAVLKQFFEVESVFFEADLIRSGNASDLLSSNTVTSINGLYRARQNFSDSTNAISVDKIDYRLNEADAAYTLSKKEVVLTDLGLDVVESQINAGYDSSSVVETPSSFTNNVLSYRFENIRNDITSIVEFDLNGETARDSYVSWYESFYAKDINSVAFSTGDKSYSVEYIKKGDAPISTLATFCGRPRAESTCANALAQIVTDTASINQFLLDENRYDAFLQLDREGTPYLTSFYSAFGAQGERVEIVAKNSNGVIRAVPVMENFNPYDEYGSTKLLNESAAVKMINVLKDASSSQYFSFESIDTFAFPTFDFDDGAHFDFGTGEGGAFSSTESADDDFWRNFLENFPVPSSADTTVSNPSSVTR